MPGDRGRDEVDRIGRLALALGFATDTVGVCRSLRDFVQAMTPMNGFVVGRYDAAARTRTCIFFHTEGAERDPTSLPVLPLNASPNSRAILERRVVIEEDYQQAATQFQVVYLGAETDPTLPQCSIVVPMMVAERVIGTLTIQSCHRGAFGDGDVAVLRMAANLAGIALENVARLEAERRQNAELLESVRAQTRELAHATIALEEQALARGLVRRLLQGVTHRAAVPPEALRALGRDLTCGVDGDDIASFARAFELMGLGSLRVEDALPTRYVVAGRDTLERVAYAGQPTCFLTLGFLEGAVASLHPGHHGLGTEVACESRGHDACRFVVAVRRHPPT